jgi:hypothetical protein
VEVGEGVNDGEGVGVGVGVGVGLEISSNSIFSVSAEFSVSLTFKPNTFSPTDPRGLNIIAEMIKVISKAAAFPINNKQYTI